MDKNGDSDGKITFNNVGRAKISINRDGVSQKNLDHLNSMRTPNDSTQTSGGLRRSNHLLQLDDMDKKSRFEQFLTYRKRLTRLAFSQCLYIYEFNFLIDQETGQKHFTPQEIDTNNIVRSIIYTYKNIFFPGKYGPINKTKKLEERFLYQNLFAIANSLVEIDEHIRRNLKGGWTLYRLDPVVRSVLRCGVYEIIYNIEVETKIITSEYTNLVAAYYEDQKVGFINAILDKISKDINRKVVKMTSPSVNRLGSSNYFTSLRKTTRPIQD